MTSYITDRMLEKKKSCPTTRRNTLSSKSRKDTGYYLNLIKVSTKNATPIFTYKIK